MCRMLHSQPSSQSPAHHRGELLGFFIVYTVSSPLQKWADKCYEPMTLADIGLRVQLGHALAILAPTLNPRLATSPSSTRAASTTSILITANATIIRRLALTTSNSYGASGFPQCTKNPSQVQRSWYLSTSTCKTFREKLWGMISIQLWRS